MLFRASGPPQTSVIAFLFSHRPLLTFTSVTNIVVSMMTYCPYDDNLYGKETASQLKLISLIVTVSGYETRPCRMYT